MSAEGERAIEDYLRWSQNAGSGTVVDAIMAHAQGQVALVYQLQEMTEVLQATLGMIMVMAQKMGIAVSDDSG
jgi:hypothetical protein